MDLKEIIDSVEKTLKDGGLKYFLVAIDEESKELTLMCSIDQMNLALAISRVIENDDRIAIPFILALKDCENKDNE